MSDVAVCIAIVLLVLMTAGTPDLLDALVVYVQAQAKVCP